MQTLKRIRLIVFVIWAALTAIVMLLFAFERISLGAALLLVLSPFIVLFNALLWLCAFTLIGDRLNSKNPPSCENCLWAKSRKVMGHCLGESLGKNFGEVCDHYAKMN